MLVWKTETQPEAVIHKKVLILGHGSHMSLATRESRRIVRILNAGFATSNPFNDSTDESLPLCEPTQVVEV
jgi:hypothetical protein